VSTLIVGLMPCLRGRVRGEELARTRIAQCGGRREQRDLTGAGEVAVWREREHERVG
jgi:hypothetical protein